MRRIASSWSPFSRPLDPARRAPHAAVCQWAYSVFQNLGPAASDLSLGLRHLPGDDRDQRECRPSSLVGRVRNPLRERRPTPMTMTMTTEPGETSAGPPL